MPLRSPTATFQPSHHHRLALEQAFTGSGTMDDSEEAAELRARCMSRLSPGQLVDTTMDKEPDSIAVDTTGDGTVDKVVPLTEREKYGV